MFDLRNIICPIENQLMGSRLISNPVDVEEILINACEEINMNLLESCFEMIQFTKENFIKSLTEERSRYYQLDVLTRSSILTNLMLIRNKIMITMRIYSSYYRSNADIFSEEIKGKLDKHFGFVSKCERYLWEIEKIWYIDNFLKSRKIYVTEELIKPSSTEEERRKIEDSYVKKLLDPANCELEKIISYFNEDQIVDKNGRVGKALQSLRQLHTSGFD